MPENTSSRPSRSNGSPPSTATAHPPQSGRTISSSSPVSSSCRPPGSSTSTRSPLKPQPARSGVISSAYELVAAAPRRRWAPPVSGIDDLLELREHLVLRGHGGAARQAGGDDGAGRVAEPHEALEVPAAQEAVTQRAAERVARAEPVHHVHRYGRDLDDLPAVVGEHALAPLLDHGEPDAGRVQRLRRLARIPR